MKAKNKPAINLSTRAVRKVVWLARLSLQRFREKIRQLRRYTPMEPYFAKRHVRKILRNYFGIDPNKIRQNKINVALIIREAKTSPKSSSFIRLIAPLTHPSISEQIAVQLYPENTTKIDPNSAVCIVQRTAYDSKDKAEKLFNHLAEYSVPLIVDNDDGFHGIDSTHPEYEAQKLRVNALDYLMSKSNEIWLSAEGLASSHTSSTADKIHIIPNSLDNRIWNRQPLKHNEMHGDQLRLVYMGTATHGADFSLIFPVLKKLAIRFPNAFQLYLIGVTREDIEDLPWITRLYQPTRGSIYPEFVSWYLQQGPFDIGLSPLVDSAFNRCKSDIKCLDYLAAGIHPIVSDILPYQNPELDSFITRVPNTSGAWEDILADFIEFPDKFRRETGISNKSAERYITINRSSETTALKQLSLIKDALSSIQSSK